jgi:serine phosphatase RsbU (regulator of sigma subunit)
LAEELRREHLIAETLQQALLLPLAEDAFSGLIVQTAYQPAWNEALVGGDFHDAVRLPGDKVALVVGDVTGKGLAAATYMAQVKFALRAILHECPEPTEALSRLNRFLMQDQPEGGGVPLVAVALAVVDPQTGDTAVSSAGAEHPLLLRANGTAEEIQAGGMLLGTLPDSRYEAAELRLAPGDSLLMVTDGLTEARHEADFFGYAGLIQAAREAQAAMSNNIGQAIIAEAKRFTGGTMHDDVCLLLVRREIPHPAPNTVVFSPGASVLRRVGE